MRWSREPPTPLPPEPSCAQVAEVLQAYLDGELGPEDAGLVAAHLEHCHRCRIEAATYERVIAAIRRQRPPVPREVSDRLTALVDDLAPPDDHAPRADRHDPPWG